MIELPILLYMAAAAFVTATLHSVGGFAGALLMAIAIAPAIGVKLTVPIVAVAMIVSHGSRAWLFRNSVDWRAFATIFIVAVPFIIGGVVFYIELSEAAVGLFLGSLLLTTVPLRRVLEGRSIQVPRAGLAVAAVPYGFLSGASFGVGMMLGPFLLGAGVVGETLIATVAVMGFLLNLIKTVAFGLSPLLTPSYMLVGAGLGLCTIPGHRLGRHLLRRTPIRVHTLFLEAFMLLGGIYFLSKGFS
ncbi:MAG: sulfite exporter TauE/SafE family protein [Kiloniellales bacterium]|nr:sulfite exporter TauE/SafE family protein [Kiloniellales bacterium]